METADETLAPWPHEDEEEPEGEVDERRPARRSSTSRDDNRTQRRSNGDRGSNRRGTTRREKPSVRKDTAHVNLSWNDYSCSGRLGEDPDVKVTKDGQVFCVRFSIAIYNGKYSQAEIQRGEDQSGNEIPDDAEEGDARRPIWMRMVAFWEAAEDFIEDEAVFHKGSAVKFFGRLRQHVYDENTYTEIEFDDYEEVIFDNDRRSNNRGRNANRR